MALQIKREKMKVTSMICDMLCELYHHNYMHTFKLFAPVKFLCMSMHANNTLHTSCFFSCILEREPHPLCFRMQFITQYVCDYVVAFTLKY